jgi:hypothetical protein
MTFDGAKKIILFDVFDEGGTFVRLRLGENPADESIKRLRLALRTVWRELSPVANVPRDIAFACGCILHFTQECFSNRKKAVTDSERAFEIEILDIAQGAFDVLAGVNAETVPRPDLDEVDA